MTVSVTTNYVEYSGNGSTTEFAVTFPFFELRAIHTDSEGTETTWAENTDYTLTGGAGTTGTLTATVAPESGETLLLIRDTSLIQDVDYVENDNFPAASHENALDRLTMIAQDSAGDLNLTLRLSETQIADGISLVLPTPSASTAIGWNASEDALTNIDLIDLEGVSINTLATLSSLASGDLFVAWDVSASANKAITKANLVTDITTGLSVTESQISDLGTSALITTDIGASVQAYDADTAKTDVAQEFSKQQNFDAGTLTDAASIAWDLDDNQVAKVTLGGNRTLAAPSNMKDGGTYVLRVIQDGTGSRTLAYNSVFKWPAGEAPTLTTDADAIDILTFISDGTNMYGVASLDFS